MVEEMVFISLSEEKTNLYHHQILQELLVLSWKFKVQHLKTSYNQFCFFL